MKILSTVNLSLDNADVLCKRDLLIYFHCTARAITREGKHFIEVVKSNTNELICKEETDENGFSYDAYTARKKCESIANDPYGNLIIAVMTHEKKRLEEEEDRKYKEDREKFYYEKENLEEVIKKKAQELFENYKKELEEKSEKELNDTK